MLQRDKVALAYPNITIVVINFALTRQHVLVLANFFVSFDTYTMLLAIGLTTRCNVIVCELVMLVRTSIDSPRLACKKFINTHTIFVCKIVLQIVVADLIPRRAEAVTRASFLQLMRKRIDFRFARIICGTSTLLNGYSTILFRVLFIRKLPRVEVVTSGARCN